MQPCNRDAARGREPQEGPENGLRSEAGEFVGVAQAAGTPTPHLSSNAATITAGNDCAPSLRSSIRMMADRPTTRCGRSTPGSRLRDAVGRRSRVVMRLYAHHSRAKFRAPVDLVEQDGARIGGLL